MRISSPSPLAPRVYSYSIRYANAVCVCRAREQEDRCLVDIANSGAKTLGENRFYA
jgi:hypothetical protein